jgi:hypothetical protein
VAPKCKIALHLASFMEWCITIQSRCKFEVLNVCFSFLDTSSVYNFGCIATLKKSIWRKSSWTKSI